MGRNSPLHENEDQASGEEIEVLWLNAGLGCDGETIALTGATQPSIDELVQVVQRLGQIVRLRSRRRR